MKHLKLGHDETMELTVQQDGNINFCIDEPWAGSTETGFGAQTNFIVTPNEAQILVDFLTVYLNAKK